MEKQLLLEVLNEIRKGAAKLLNEALDFVNDPKKNGMDSVKELLDVISEKIEIGKEVLSPESIKIALSYREIFRDAVTFKELVSLIKREYTLSPGMSVCVLKTEKKNAFPVFDIMACSAEKEIQFAPACPWCHVVVAAPDPELLKMFGEKSMLVLK